MCPARCAGDNKLGFVRDGLEQLIDALRDDDQISIITYSDTARVEFPMSEVSLNRGELREIIRGMTPDGGTNIYDGLELGYQTVFDAYDSGRQNRLIFLSDGEATAGNTADSSILDMSSSYNSDGVGITTVGLGTGFNRDLMRGLAEQGDGNFYFLEDAGAVDEVFQEEDQLLHGSCGIRPDPRDELRLLVRARGGTRDDAVRGQR